MGRRGRGEGILVKKSGDEGRKSRKGGSKNMSHSSFVWILDHKIIQSA